MKKKFCDIGNHECDVLFHARRNDRPSACPIHAPRTQIKKVTGQLLRNIQSVEQEPKIIKGRPKKDKAHKSIPELIKLADIVFSRWIKKRDAFGDGTFKCISCGQFKSIKVAQNGHYYSRNFTAVRYHEDNCHLECVGCNCLDDHHLIGYRANLEIKIGSERLKWLDDNYKSGHKWDRSDLLELIKKYKL